MKTDKSTRILSRAVEMEAKKENRQRYFSPAGKFDVLRRFWKPSISCNHTEAKSVLTRISLLCSLLLKNYLGALNTTICNLFMVGQAMEGFM